MKRLNKQEMQDYIMYIQNKYDLLVNIQEQRGISYGELNYVESLSLKGLEELEEEIETELSRIAQLLHENGYDNKVYINTTLDNN